MLKLIFNKKYYSLSQWQVIVHNLNCNIDEQFGLGRWSMNLFSLGDIASTNISAPRWFAVTAGFARESKLINKCSSESQSTVPRRLENSHIEKQNCSRQTCEPNQPQKHSRNRLKSGASERPPHEHHVEQCCTVKNTVQAFSTENDMP